MCVLFSFAGRYWGCLSSCGCLGGLWFVHDALLCAESLCVRHFGRGGGMHGYDFGSCNNVRAILSGSKTL